MPRDDTQYRAAAIARMAENKSEAPPSGQSADKCGPEPPRPNYFSSQEVRDTWIKWNLCKAGA